MKDHRKKVIFEKDKREVREREKHVVKIAGRGTQEKRWKVQGFLKAWIT